MERIQSAEELEKILTDRRVAELASKPPPEVFNTDTLRATHRHIFQDFRKFDQLLSPSPGEFRDPLRSGDWSKMRDLQSVPLRSYTCYSPMDAASRAELDDVLKTAQPERLSKLPPKEFAKEISALYAHLDYIHPFENGNSRTLRTFTKNLARASGYSLQWETLAKTPQDQDLLALARDRATGEIAKDRLRNEDNAPFIESSLRKFAKHPRLEELVSEITRPSRAVAFEAEDKQTALQRHPELASSYALMRSVALQAEADGYTMRERAAIITRARQNIVAALDRGDIPAVQLKEEHRRAPARDHDLSR